jgi:hypothetical protein
MPKARTLRSRSTLVGKRRKEQRRRGPLRRKGRMLLADIVLKLPCATFTCTSVEILEYKEPATPALVTSVKGPQGQEITAAAKPALHREILDAIFAPLGPGTDTPEKNWPTTYLYDTCPAGCTCPAAAMNFGNPEDTTQDVEVPVDRRMPSGQTKTYQVTVRIRVRRRIGTAQCT